MSGSPINLYVRTNTGGIYAISPDAPGLVIAKRDMEELRCEIQGILQFYFGCSGEFEVVEHLVSDEDAAAFWGFEEDE